MLALALFSAALAICTLPDGIDPNGVCVTDANGFSTIDAANTGGKKGIQAEKNQRPEVQVEKKVQVETRTH